MPDLTTINPETRRVAIDWLLDLIDQEMVHDLGEMQDERDVVMALRGAVKQLPALIEVAAAARAMVEDGFPHTGAGDEWFDMDGFGPMFCDVCGWCSHPSRTGYRCDACGEIEGDDG